MKKLITYGVLLIGLASCASTETDFSTRNKLYFLSKNELIDVVSVEGIDLGKMYRPSSKSVTFKNFGKKGLITYDGIKVGNEIIIKWRPSKKDNAVVKEIKLKRSDTVPSELPPNTSLVLEYLGDGKWNMFFHNDIMFL